MFGREVDGPLWAVFRPLLALTWAVVGHFWDLSGRVRLSWVSCGLSWAFGVHSWEGMWGLCGQSWDVSGLCGWSSAALGGHLGGLGRLLGPMWAVLGSPGATVGSLGRG